MLGERLVHPHEDDAQLLQVLADVVVDHLGVVLRAHAGEEFLLRLGNPQLVERVPDVIGHVVPGTLVPIGRAHEVVGCCRSRGCPGDPWPRAVLHLVEALKRVQPVVAHPLRLVLHVRDHGDDLGREALVRLEERLFVVVEAPLVAVLADQLRCRGHGRLPLRPSRRPLRWRRTRSPRALRRARGRPSARCARRSARVRTVA